MRTTETNGEIPSVLRAWRAFDEDGRVAARLVDQPLAEVERAGGVLVRVAWAGVNYKDALAATGRAPVVRRFPCTLGIEAAGTVARSDDARFAPGDAVIVHGFGLGAERDGGFAEWVAAPADQVVRLPAALTVREAATIGVAGYTAALAIDAMQANGLTPAAGPVAVTGATGGVGALAVDMLAASGHRVHAITRKPDDGWLRALGADAVGTLEPAGDRPLGRVRWAGAMDALGGAALDALLRTMQPDGVVASYGNATGNALSTSVLPFILRGVRLLGINANSPMALRTRIWARLATDLRPRHLDRIATPIGLDDLPGACERLMAGEARGRFVVRMTGVDAG